MKSPLPQKIPTEDRKIGDISVGRTRFDKIEETINTLIDHLSQREEKEIPQWVLDRAKGMDFKEVWNGKDGFTPQPVTQRKENTMNDAEIAILDNLLYLFGTAILDKKYKEDNPRIYPKAQDILDASDVIKKSGQEVIDFILKVRLSAIDQYKEKLKDEALKEYGRGQNDGIQVERESLKMLIEGSMYKEPQSEAVKGYNRALQDILNAIT